MKVIIFLGNVGLKYMGTRHNVAWDIIGEKNWDDASKKLFSHVSQEIISGKEALFIKPQTMMNISGKAAQAVKNWYKLQNEDFLVVYDDIALEVGEFKLSFGRGDGNHNGVKSIINSLGGKNFSRLRIGVGTSTNSHIPLREHVLQKFSDNEIDILLGIKKDITKSIDLWAEKGVELAMNEMNGKALATKTQTKHL